MIFDESPPGTTTPSRACAQCPMRHTVYPYTPDTHVHTRPRASSSRDRHSTTTMSAVLALNTAGLIPLRARASVARKNARAAVAPKVRTRTTIDRRDARVECVAVMASIDRIDRSLPRRGCRSRRRSSPPSRARDDDDVRWMSRRP